MGQKLNFVQVFTFQTLDIRYRLSSSSHHLRSNVVAVKAAHRYCDHDLCTASSALFNAGLSFVCINYIKCAPFICSNTLFNKLALQAILHHFTIYSHGVVNLLLSKSSVWESESPIYIVLRMQFTKKLKGFGVWPYTGGTLKNLV